MEWQHESIDWLDVLKKKRALSGKTIRLIQLCLDSRGYVSGGFARLIAVLLMKEKKVISSRKEDRDAAPWDAVDQKWPVWDQVSSYCLVFGNYEKRSEERLWKSGAGDVDVFFPDALSASLAVRRAIEMRLDKWNSKTLANYGHEFLVENNIVQMIEKVTGSPEEVLSGFDIANAKVYLNSRGLFWTEEWAQLEENKLLGVDIWDRQNLLWRISKWIRKHGYTNLRPGDHENWVDLLIGSAELCHNKKLVRFSKEVDIRTIRWIGKDLLLRLPPRDLLKASLIYDSYENLRIMRHVSDATRSCQE